VQNFRQWLLNRPQRPQNEEARRRRLRPVARWLLLLLFLIPLLFCCGQLALLDPGSSVYADTASKQKADYGPWPYLVLNPIDPGIIDAIRDDEARYESGENRTVTSPIIIGEADFWAISSRGAATAVAAAPEAQTATALAKLVVTTTPSPAPFVLSSLTPSSTPSATLTPLGSPSRTPTAYLTRTPSATPTTTATPSATFTRTRVPTLPASATSAATTATSATPTATPTTPPPTNPAPTATTLAATSTPTPTGTATNTPTPTETPTSTTTPTETATPTSTPTPTATPNNSFVVNVTGDAVDANTADGICETATVGECSLRAAIEQANVSAGANIILFNIPGSGLYSIAVTTWLPSITDAVVIDGATQPGFSGTPIIELNGNATTYDGFQAGLVIIGGNSTVRGLAINRFAVDGIRLQGGSNNIIQGNYIGADVTGLLDRGNGFDGIFITGGSTNNTIGGLTVADRNVIAGNDDEGIDVRPGSSNLIVGNLIGVAADGATPLGNGSDGVLMSSSGASNQMTQNLISSNAGLGINLDGGNQDASGVTANDGALTAGQPNLLMDYPLFTSAVISGATLTVSGYIGIAPNDTDFANARVEIFKSDDDASGYGESQIYLGFLMADANGNFSGSLIVSGVSTGDKVTGTATDASNNTSEFGPNFTVTSGSRATADLQVLYAFEEGSGTTVNDVSGVGAPLNLTIANPANTTWLAGGLSVDASTIIQSAGAATKIITACQSTNEITVEVWVQPVSLSQGGGGNVARIISISTNTSNRNVALVQGDGTLTDLYSGRLRTTATDNNGFPTLDGPSGSLTTALTHVVYTHDSAGNTLLYVNNALVASGTTSGNFSNWDSGYALGLANEFTLDRSWLGRYYLTAIYNRALTSGEVTQNFNAGP